MKAELLKLIDVTRAEKGCLQYDLHQDNKNSGHFLFYENWESREHFKVHMNTPHLKNFIAFTEGALDELTIHEMSHTA